MPPCLYDQTPVLFLKVIPLSAYFEVNLTRFSEAYSCIKVNKTAATNNTDADSSSILLLYFCYVYIKSTGALFGRMLQTISLLIVQSNLCSVSVSLMWQTWIECKILQHHIKKDKPYLLYISNVFLRSGYLENSYPTMQMGGRTTKLVN